ncbi:MAG: MFS transporter [Acidobacteria bacterium]|nr:MAG: MFS transporter [Acidobacteriota bacterium]
MAARAARSVGQGAMVAAFALYLHALGFTASAIGAVLAAGALFGALLTAVVGPLSDRRGRRGLLLVYETMTAATAAVALATADTHVLVAAAVIGGFGRGANGAAGPFAPVEQAWLARLLPRAQRGHVFSLNSALGFAGMAIGAVLAAGLHLALGGASLVNVDRALFALPLAGAIASFFLVLGAEDPALAPLAASAAEQTARRRRENRHLAVLAAANGLNGFGIGMVGPLMAYWFARRYGHDLASIGPAIALSFVLGAAGSVLAGRMVLRHGVVGTVWRMRLVGLVLLALTPLSPSFGLAVALYAVRAAFNQGTAGVRQALAAGLTDARRRGLASTLNNLSLQIPRAAGPLLAGALLHRGHLELPFFIAAAFQLAYLIVYTRAFRYQDTAPADAD